MQHEKINPFLNNISRLGADKSVKVARLAVVQKRAPFLKQKSPRLRKGAHKVSATFRTRRMTKVNLAAQVIDFLGSLAPEPRKKLRAALRNLRQEERVPFLKQSLPSARG